MDKLKSEEKKQKTVKDFDINQIWYQLPKPLSLMSRRILTERVAFPIPKNAKRRGKKKQ